MRRAGSRAGRGRLARLLWPDPREGRSRAWRLATPLAFGCAGLLAVTSAVNAKGTDLRGGRNTSLLQLVSSDRQRVEAEQRQATGLQAEVDRLSADLRSAQSDALQKRVDQIGHPAGMSALRGPGLVVTLSDAPRDQEVPAGTDPNVLVVHQQDIQAVANALWQGGAEGISLQGTRIVSTTGIKCVGNTVVLQGEPYGPPYRLVAVGPITPMYAALVASPEVATYREYVPPPYNIGWSVRTERSLSVPAYTGSTDLQYATAIGS